MAYTTATPVPSVESSRNTTLVIFTGDAGEKAAIEAPAGVDLVSWAKGQFAQLNARKVEQTKVVYNVALDLSDKAKTPEQAALDTYTTDRAALAKADADLQLGLAVAEHDTLLAKAQASRDAWMKLKP